MSNRRRARRREMGAGADDLARRGAPLGGSPDGSAEPWHGVITRLQSDLPGWAGWALVALLPLLLLAVDREWIVSGPHPDYWLYYGWFRNALEYLQDVPAHYHASRLSVHLVGMAFHTTMPPVVANLALHLCLFWATLAGFLVASTLLVGRRAAILATGCFALHPFVVQALGKNYVDGFGICYYLLALACLLLAARGTARRLGLAAGGAFLVAVVSANLLFSLYVPLALALFLVADRPFGIVKTLRAAGWVLAGAAPTFLYLCVVSGAAGGELLFLLPSLRFAHQFESGSMADVWSRPASEWLPGAIWLAVPTAITLASALHLLARRWRDQARPLLAGAAQLQLVVLAGVLLVAQLRGALSAYQHFYATSVLLPLVFLAFAGQLAVLLPALGTRAFTATTGAVVAAGLAPWIVDAGHPASASLLGARPLVPLAAVAAIGAGALLLRPSTGALAFRLLTLLVPSAMVLGLMPERVPGGDHWGYFRQTTAIIEAIERYDPSLQTRLWYNPADAAGPALHSVGASFMLCPRVVTIAFPLLDLPVLCGQVPLQSGQQIAVMSTLPDAAQQATTRLAELGFTSVLEGQEHIPGPAGDVVVTFLQTERTCALP